MKKVTAKIKFFFEVLVKSLTKFVYYKEISKTKFKFSLKYLLFLFYIISLVGSLIFAGSVSVILLPKVPKFVADFESKAKSLYPASLVVNVKDGVLTSNQKEPYFIDSLNQLGINSGTSHFITIDTKASVSDYKKENTLILITKDSVVIPEKDTTYKVYPIDNGTNMTVDESGYNSLIGKISPYLKYIQPVLIALIILSILVWPIIGAALATVGELIYLAIFSCVLYVITKLMKKEFTIKKLIQLSIHAATLPILLGFIVSSFGIQMPPFLGSAVLLVFMILVVNQF